MTLRALVLSKEFRRRFYSRVRIGARDACWPWLGAKDDYGYGRLKVNGIQTRAHRVALILKTGVDPPTKQTLHDPIACNNPACCNDRHLRWGTRSENLLDYYNRGRAS